MQIMVECLTVNRWEVSTPLGSLLICKPARKHPYPLVKGSHTTGLRAFHRFEGLLVRVLIELLKGAISYRACGRERKDSIVRGHLNLFLKVLAFQSAYRNLDADYPVDDYFFTRRPLVRPRFQWQWCVSGASARFETLLMNLASP